MIRQNWQKQSFALLLHPRVGCEILWSARLSARIFKKTRSNFKKFSVHQYMLPVATAQFLCNNAIRYVIPVLWMTSYFHIMGQVQIQAWSLRCGELFTTTWHRKLCTWGQSLLLPTALFKHDKKINKFLHDRCLANIQITSSMSSSTIPNKYCVDMPLLSHHYSKFIRSTYPF